MTLDYLGVPAEAAIPPDVLARAEQIVEMELDLFRRWLRARAVAPVIAALQQRADQIADDELRRLRLGGLDARQRDTVRAAVRGAMSRLLHTPIVRLKTSSGDRAIVDLARDLFDLRHSEE